MGRLATNIAAAAADADNMPSTEKLPSVSLIDALLPRRLASIGSPSSKEKPTDPNVGRKTYVTYYDVRKSKNGSKSIVAHKSASPSAASDNGKGGRKSAQKGETVNVGRKAQSGGGEGGETKGTNGNKASESRIYPGRKTNRTGKKGGKPQTKEQEEAAAKKREERQKRREETEKPVSLAPAPAPAPANPKKPTNGSIEPLPGGLPTNAAAAAGDETRFTLHEWLTLQSDSLFTISELQCLSEIIMRDQSQTWLRIASVFYDKTGRKVHPEDIREKFEQMAGMG
ncbi:hypothetical protein KC354_g4941 [Hortaea werneckii]|nr:hypothetical protein KC354_g4941 [Hortaea werneckii]